MEKSPIEILVFEGELAQAGMIREMLAEPRPLEFLVQHVRCLEDGIELLRSRDFDVILLDLALPDSQGLETALAVRNQARQTPLIVMTALDDEEATLKALQFDIQDYLIKEETTGSLLKRSIRYAIQRKRDIEALRQSERRFISFMLHLPAAAWIKDLHGRYVYVNEEAARYHLFPLPEVLGKKDEEILPPETAKQLRENDERVLAEGESLQTVEVLRQADGIDHHILVCKFPVPGPDSRAAYVAGIALDITERMRAEEALRKSEEKFATIFHSAPALVAISTLEEGRFVDVNDTTLQLLGYRRDEMIGRTALELNLWADLSDRAIILQTLEKEGAARNIEVRLRGKSGQTLVCLFSAEYIELDGDRYMLSLIRDITERKQAEDALRFSEARFRAVHDANPAMILTIDAEGNIISTNPACTDHLGYSSDELEGRPVLKIFHEDDRPAVAEQLQMCRQNPDQVYRWEFRKVRKDGGPCGWRNWPARYTT
jgi:PAS domain S-box-containing protein